MTADLAYTSAAELAALIARRAVSPVEAVDVVLDRIEKTQPTLNAFITVCAEEARAAAKDAEAAVMRGDTLGALHGVPFAVKDFVNTAGVRTTFGSWALADNVPSTDSPSVARLKGAGAILVGKTTTPEFGHKCFTDAPLFGRTANPWDLSRTCGGSSGGAAAAVAAGLAPIGIGTGGVEPHPGLVLRCRRFQANAGPGAARPDPGRVRQPGPHDADDPHRHGQRAD